MWNGDNNQTQAGIPETVNPLQEQLDAAIQDLAEADAERANLRDRVKAACDQRDSKTRIMQAVGEDIKNFLINEDISSENEDVTVSASTLIEWAETLGATMTKQVEETFQVTVTVTVPFGFDTDYLSDALEVSASHYDVEVDGYDFQ